MNLRSFSISIFAAVAVVALSGMKGQPSNNYQNAIEQLDLLVKNNADVAQKFVLAKSDSGETIWGVRIAKATTKNRQGDIDLSPRLVVASHHGNELLSVDLALQFTKDLIEETRHPKWGDAGDQTYYIIPALNVTGYNKEDRFEKNAAGTVVDPNRDYPDPCGPKNSFQLKSTKALADFMTAKKIISAVTIHGYVGTFTYPWGTYAENTHTADHFKFDTLGKAAVRENGYQTGTHADVIYPTAGAFEDWAYSELGTWTMLLELDNQPNLANDSKALLRFFADVPKSASKNHNFAGKCRANRPADRNIRARP